MKLTRAHFDFYAYHNAPPYLRALVPAPPVPIPATAAERDLDKSFTKHNLSVLVKGCIRRGGDLRAFLFELTHSPGTVIRPARRAATARKWLAKLTPTT